VAVERVLFFFRTLLGEKFVDIGQDCRGEKLFIPYNTLVVLFLRRRESKAYLTEALNRCYITYRWLTLLRTKKKEYGFQYAGKSYRGEVYHISDCGVIKSVVGKVKGIQQSELVVFSLVGDFSRCKELSTLSEGILRQGKGVWIRSYWFREIPAELVRKAGYILIDHYDGELEEFIGMELPKVDRGGIVIVSRNAVKGIPIRWSSGKVTERGRSFCSLMRN